MQRQFSTVAAVGVSETLSLLAARLFFVAAIVSLAQIAHRFDVGLFVQKTSCRATFHTKLYVLRIKFVKTLERSARLYYNNSKQEETTMIFEKVQKLLAESLNIDPSKITPESNVVQDLGADSLDMVELLMSLEDNFGITVPDEAANELVTVDAIVKYIEQHKK